ncbi:MAG: lipid-A-disaccharide synthase [Planctomycetaceae bacterium TMED240]|nr:lipid-A-disaccharide synthase [Rhodopirellula sp.]OUX08700.1 MAG: lipid-A-disaccharide synthase [Planctomycetaceae bacterium TMED240]
MSANIFFSVGEPSGDQHAARMVSQILALDSTIQLRGFGGQAMRDAGCHLDRDLTQHAVVGLIEVIPKLRQFFRFADEAEEIFRQGNVDAVVLVDFPGFNWHIAKRAKKYGIPVYYYCPPQLWAWGGWRIHKMKRSVDHVLAVLPVEKDYFERRGIPTTFVGHPFFDAVACQPLDHQLLGRFRDTSLRGEHLVAVLPGSREHEVHSNWPLMLEAIRRLHRVNPRTRFLVAAYRDRQCLWCRDQMTEDDQELPIEFFVDRTSEVVEAARCAMMVSGSVSLELMARRTPAAVVYRVGRVLHTVGKHVLRLDSITLPNLMSDRKVFPEMVSVGKTEPAIDFLTQSVHAMLNDHFYFQGLLESLDRLRDQYAQPGASQRAAEFIHPRLSGSAGMSKNIGNVSDLPRRAA